MFVLRDKEGNKGHAVYDEFSVGPETDGYRLHIDGYRPSTFVQYIGINLIDIISVQCAWILLYKHLQCFLLKWIEEFFLTLILRVTVPVT